MRLRDLFANFKESMDFFAKVPVEVREQGLCATRLGGALERSGASKRGDLLRTLIPSNKLYSLIKHLSWALISSLI
jgi:hypothetical protein